MVLVGVSYFTVSYSKFIVIHRKCFISKIYFAKNAFISLESILGGPNGKEHTKVDADFS